MSDFRDIHPFPFGEIGQPSEELDHPTEAGAKALLDLWTSKLAGREMPAKKDIRPSEMTRYLPHIYIVDILDQGHDFRIRLSGSSVAEMLRADYTGTVLSETPPELHWRGEIYRLAYQRRKPVFYLFELAPFGRETVMTENALFPLLGDSDEFEHLLCISVETGRMPLKF